MKNFVRRGLSLLLALVMCIGLLSGISFAATVDYQTGDADETFTGIIKNWGTRGTTATFLSPNAESFYADNEVTYESLSALAGSADATTSSELYLALRDLMVNNHSKVTTYNETRPLYAFTDCQNSDTSSISSFYSGKAIGPVWDAGATWNREHTWPDSKGLEGRDEDDIMMLRPTASNENSARGNKAYGESDGFYDPNSVSNNVYNLRGDVARTMLYVYVRWSNPNIWGADGVLESLELMLRWMEEDPVDTWEMGRNDSVESITGTRNVFVDYPELAFKLFAADVPTDMTTPSGEAINAGSTVTITATSSNTAYGTVSVTGNTINAVPATGYKATGYNVTAGTATVTQNGNAFTVNASTDCTVEIIFEAKAAYTVTYMEDGNAASSAAAYESDIINLPDVTTTPEGYTFRGWVTAELAETSVQPETVYAVADKYTVTGDVTFYALYSRVDTSGAGGASSAFELYTGEITDGNYLIVSNGGAMEATIYNDRFVVTTVEIANNVIDNPTPYTTKVLELMPPPPVQRIRVSCPLPSPITAHGPSPLPRMAPAPLRTCTTREPV